MRVDVERGTGESVDRSRLTGWYIGVIDRERATKGEGFAILSSERGVAKKKEREKIER